jgi:hypothetical protein
VQGCRQSVAHRGVAGFVETGGPRHGSRHQIRVHDRGQRGEAHAVGKVRTDLGGDGEGEGGLADAAGAGQGEEADVGPTQERNRQRQLALAANERRERYRRRDNPKMVRR